MNEVFNTEGMTTLQALAEVLQSKMNPQTTDSPKIEFEDVLEEVRNAYLFVVWYNERNDRSAGERSAFQALLKRKRIPATADTTEISISDMSIVDLPRDEGIASVIAVNEKGFFIGGPLTKSAVATQHRIQHIQLGKKYTRIDNKIYFPEGLPACTSGVEIAWLGMEADSDKEIFISRTVAAQVMSRFKSEQQLEQRAAADITPNKDPNQ